MEGKLVDDLKTLSSIALFLLLSLVLLLFCQLDICICDHVHCDTQPDLHLDFLD